MIGLVSVPVVLNFERTGCRRYRSAQTPKAQEWTLLLCVEVVASEGRLVILYRLCAETEEAQYPYRPILHSPTLMLDCQHCGCWRPS